MSQEFEQFKEASRDTVAAMNQEAMELLEQIERAVARLRELTQEKSSPERVAGAGLAMGLALYAVQKASKEYTDFCFKSLGADQAERPPQ